MHIGSRSATEGRSDRICAVRQHAIEVPHGCGKPACRTLNFGKIIGGAVDDGVHGLRLLPSAMATYTEDPSSTVMDEVVSDTVEGLCTKV